MSRPRILTAALLLATTPFAAFAQAPQPPQAAEGAPITRDQFVQRATQNAAKHAGEHFDQIDTAHTGTITRAQLRAWRQAHGHFGNQSGG